MLGLSKKLEDWQKHNFITADQTSQILHYENSKEKNWPLLSFILLGVFVIGTGIVSLVAANWEDISSTTKLFSDLVIFLALAGTTFYAYSKQKFWLLDSLIFFIILFSLATIGLISQIYHTGGELYEATILVSLVTLPLSFFAKNRLIYWLWASLFFISYPFVLKDFILLNFDRHYEHITVYYCFFSLVCLLSFIIHSSFFKDYIKPVLVYTFIFSIILMLATDEIFYGRAWNRIHYTKFSYLISGLFLFSIISFLYCKNLIKKQKVFISLALCLHFLLILFTHPIFSLNVFWGQCMSAAFAVLIGFVYAILCLLFDKKRWFHFMVLLIGLRFIWIYFQVFGSLAMTGLGLIVSGIFILLFVGMWYKFKDSLGIWIKAKLS